jgi:hypothetical protein
VKRLTFEFPTPGHAADFADECLDVSVRHHRVVEVEPCDEQECRELARQHGGREYPESCNV